MKTGEKAEKEAKHLQIIRLEYFILRKHCIRIWETKKHQQHNSAEEKQTKKIQEKKNIRKVIHHSQLPNEFFGSETTEGPGNGVLHFNV